MDKQAIIDLYIKEALLFDTLLDDAFLKNFLQKNNIEYGSLLIFFPAGQNDIIKHLIKLWNEKALEKYDGEDMKFSQKIETILSLKVEAALEYEKLFSNIFRTLIQPKYSLLALEIIAEETNFILLTAKDKSIDFSYYTKRLTLSGVYSMVFFTAFKKKNLHQTRNFIRKRIANIGQFARVKNNFLSYIKERIDFFQ